MEADFFSFYAPALILLLPLLVGTVILLGREAVKEYAEHLALGGMGLALLLSLGLFFHLIVVHGGRNPLADASYQDAPLRWSLVWMDFGRLKLRLGFMIDNVGAVMTAIVCLLGFLVMIYSIFYMAHDKHQDRHRLVNMYPRYYAMMSFFCFSMLGIVLSDNLLMTYVFWELVGLGSYFLIGFWFYKPPVADDADYQRLKAAHATGINEHTLSPAFAQKKAFVMNRVGDFGFVVGLMILFAVMLQVAALPEAAALAPLDHPFGFPKLYAAAQQGWLTDPAKVGLDLFGSRLSGEALLTLATICIFCGAIGKSAQFPLHTWLPDAMQGPTTGSSIIHAATMVAAGVYLTLRLHPLLTPASSAFIATIGGITALLAATIACVQWDIKAVLAYSTISQLGFMITALGCGGYTAGGAHLYTHAFFKCMLFLCAGSVILAGHHNQDMFKMGGLRRKMPLTFATMLVGTLAIAGCPFFSAFFSKDLILAACLEKALRVGGWGWLSLVFLTVAAFLTCYYMFRLLFMTFCGETRDTHLYGHARESPAVATVPLVVLAAFCLGVWWSGSLDLAPGASLKVGEGWIKKTIVRPQTHYWDLQPRGEKPGEGGSGVAAGAASLLPVGHAAAASPERPLHAGGAPGRDHGDHLAHVAHVAAGWLSLLLFAGGLVAAWYFWYRRPLYGRVLVGRSRPLQVLWTFLAHLWYVDRFYEDEVVGSQKWVSQGIATFDFGDPKGRENEARPLLARARYYLMNRGFVDGVLVDGWRGVFEVLRTGVGRFDDWIIDWTVDRLAVASDLLGRMARLLQYGKVQFYLFLTAMAAATLVWWVL